MRLLPIIMFLSLCLPAVARPSAEQARSFVENVASWSLMENRLPVDWEVGSKHGAEFDPELLKLMEWVSTPHPDIEGRHWHYEVDPIWQVQSSQVTRIKIGTPKPEGDTMLVVVDYVSPSAISPNRPSSKFHNVWVISERDGRPVLQDIRYHIKHPIQTDDGSLFAALKKAKASFRAPE